jgi:general secretion pathway protein B
MSYILDALQRANAERQRGTVPGLHAYQLTQTARPAGSSAGHRLVPALVVTGALGSLAAGLWLWRGQEPARIPRPVGPIAAAPAVESPPPLAALAVPATRAASLTPTPTSMVPTATVANLPQPNVEPPAITASLGKPSIPSHPWLADLPDDLRRQMPALAITGVVYSDNPGQRLLLINGQVLPQGSAVTPDVTLEDIGEHHSVFSFHGTRFKLAH